jgi:hypothetical protein
MLAGLAFLVIESLFADRILGRNRSRRDQLSRPPQHEEVA